MLDKLKQFLPELFFLGLTISLLLTNIVWILLNKAPPPWDEAAHTWRTLDFSYSFSLLFNGSPNFLTTLLNALKDPYPPLIKLLGALVVILIYPDIRIIQLLGTFFFISELLILYLLAKELFHNSWVALLSVFFFSTHLIFIQKSRFISLDIALTFFITTAFYFFITSKYLEKRKEALLFFLCLGLACLTKIQAPIYLIIPLCFGLFCLFQKKGAERSYMVKTCIYGVLIVLGLILPWFLISIQSVVNYYFFASSGETYDPKDYFSLITWIYYLKSYINFGTGLVGFLIGFIGLIFALRRKNIVIYLLFFQIVFVYIIFSVFPNKDPRYLMPIIPFISLIAGEGLFFFLKKNYYFLLPFVFVWILFYVLLYVNLSFGIPYPKGKMDILSPVQIPYFNDLIFVHRTDSVVQKYDENDWPHERIVNDLHTELGNNHECCVVLVPDYEKFNFNSLMMYERLAGYDSVQFIQPESPFLPQSQDELNQKLNNYRYFLYTDVEPGVFDQLNINLLKGTQKYIENLLTTGQASPIKRYTLPTGQTLLLIKRS